MTRKGDPLRDRYKDGLAPGGRQSDPIRSRYEGPRLDQPTEPPAEETPREDRQPFRRKPQQHHKRRPHEEEDDDVIAELDDDDDEDD